MKTWEEFVSRYSTKQFPKGVTILHQGDKPDILYVIKEGFVLCHDISNDGTIRPIITDRKLEILPIGWLFDKVERTQFFYKAYTRVVLWVIPKEEIKDFLIQNPQSQFALYGDTVERMLELQARFLTFQQTKALNKVAMSLIFSAERFGVPSEGGMVLIDAPISQQDIANFLGITRETVSIQIGELEKLGVLRRKGQKYFVHKDSLRRLICKY